MTPLLKQAFDEASKLSELEQDMVARWMLLDPASERRWDELFEESQDVLSELADEALAEHRQIVRPAGLEKQQILSGLQQACRDIKKQESGEMPEQTLDQFLDEL